MFQAGLEQGRSEVASEYRKCAQAELEEFIHESEKAETPPSPAQADDGIAKVCRNCAGLIGDDIYRELAKCGRCYLQHGKEMEDLDHSWCYQWKAVVRRKEKETKLLCLDCMWFDPRKRFCVKKRNVNGHPSGRPCEHYWLRKNATCKDCAMFVEARGCKVGILSPLEGNGAVCGEFKPKEEA
jgi:hypothetical protein